VILHKGDNADYVCKVSGYPKPTVKWLINGKIITSTRLRPVATAYGSKLIILAASEDDKGVVSCVAQNYEGRDERKLYVNVYG